MHRLKRSWHLCPRRVNAGNKNTPSMHHPRKQNVTTFIVGLKKRSHTQNLNQNGEPKRYSWEHTRRSFFSTLPSTTITFLIITATSVFIVHPWVPHLHVQDLLPFEAQTMGEHSPLSSSQQMFLKCYWNILLEKLVCHISCLDKGYFVKFI